MRNYKGLGENGREVFRTLSTIYDGSFDKKKLTQPAFTCTKLKLETLEQGVKYVQR